MYTVSILYFWYFFEADELQFGDLLVEGDQVEVPGKVVVVGLGVDVPPQLLDHPSVAEGTESLLQDSLAPDIHLLFGVDTSDFDQKLVKASS